MEFADMISAFIVIAGFNVIGLMTIAVRLEHRLSKLESSVYYIQKQLDRHISANSGKH